ncbi:MAG: thioesterase [Chitinophagia bacterium]|nr:thioesterase [Chitinophagia bacterium]
MSSLKSQLPTQFSFYCDIPLRITDLNYGGHVGNDRIMALLQEARVQFLAHKGYSELDIEGSGILLTKANVELRCELHYGYPLRASVSAGNFTSKGFDLFYKLETTVNDTTTIAALAITTMVCYDYKKKKVVTLAERALQNLSS